MAVYMHMSIRPYRVLSLLSQLKQCVAMMPTVVRRTKKVTQTTESRSDLGEPDSDGDGEEDTDRDRDSDSDSDSDSESTETATETEHDDARRMDSLHLRSFNRRLLRHQARTRRRRHPLDAEEKEKADEEAREKDSSESGRLRDGQEQGGKRMQKLSFMEAITMRQVNSSLCRYMSIHGILYKLILMSIHGILYG